MEMGESHIWDSAVAVGECRVIECLGVRNELSPGIVLVMVLGRAAWLPGSIIQSSSLTHSLPLIINYFINHTHSSISREGVLGSLYSHLLDAVHRAHRGRIYIYWVIIIMWTYICGRLTDISTIIRNLVLTRTQQNSIRQVYYSVRWT